MADFTLDEQFTLIFFVLDKQLWLPLCQELRLSWSEVVKDHLQVKHGTMMSAVGFIVGVLIGTLGRDGTVTKLKELGGEDPLAWAAAKSMPFEPHPI